METWGPLVAIVVAIVLKLFWFRPRRRRQIEETKLFAQQMAKRRWYVKEAMVFQSETTQELDAKGWFTTEWDGVRKNDESAYLKIISADPERWEVFLPISPSHPSIKALGDLKYLSVIQFQFIEHPLTCALETEHCAYLVMKG